MIDTEANFHPQLPEIPFQISKSLQITSNENRTTQKVCKSPNRAGHGLHWDS